MSFPAYPEYKSSETDWLGNIPSDWRVQKFRFTFRESAEKIEAAIVGQMLSVSGYRGIEIKQYDDENRRRADEDLIGYRIVRSGQLVVNTMWLNYAGLGVSSHEGYVSPAYRSYWFADESAQPRFIHYLMRSSVYVQGYTQLLTGIRPNSLQMSREDLMDFPVVLPPKPDQNGIAAFLDRETAKIDALVEEQRRLIALLKEKRQAVISHAVTMGLNPNAPMKPSGIEWLGDIPAHWKMIPLKRTAKVLAGYAFPANGFSEDCDNWRLLRGINLSASGIRWNDDTAYWERSGHDGLDEWALQIGDIVLGMDRPWIGEGLRVSAITEADLPCLLLQRVAAIKADCVSAQRFILQCLRHEAFFHHCAPDMTGVSVPHISGGQIEEFRIPLPPVPESPIGN